MRTRRRSRVGNNLSLIHSCPSGRNRPFPNGYRPPDARLRALPAKNRFHLRRPQLRAAAAISECANVLVSRACAKGPLSGWVCVNGRRISPSGSRQKQASREYCRLFNCQPPPEPALQPTMRCPPSGRPRHRVSAQRFAGTRRKSRRAPTEDPLTSVWSAGGTRQENHISRLGEGLSGTEAREPNKLSPAHFVFREKCAPCDRGYRMLHNHLFAGCTERSLTRNRVRNILSSSCPPRGEFH